MTHIDNVAHIHQYGITHHSSTYANPHYKPIGNVDLITKRGEYLLSNGHYLGEYIPFYFCVKSPMLYVLQKKGLVIPADVVYCVTSVETIIVAGLSFLFTDGHAYEKITHFYGAEDIVNIRHLVDFNAVNARQWGVSPDSMDVKRRKQAEFLVLGDIPRSAVLGFIVYNKNSWQKLVSIGIPSDQIAIRPQFYYS